MLGIFKKPHVEESGQSSTQENKQTEATSGYGALTRVKNTENSGNRLSKTISNLFHLSSSGDVEPSSLLGDNKILASLQTGQLSPHNTYEADFDNKSKTLERKSMTLNDRSLSPKDKEKKIFSSIKEFEINRDAGVKLWGELNKIRQKQGDGNKITFDLTLKYVDITRKFMDVINDSYSEAKPKAISKAVAEMRKYLIDENCFNFDVDETRQKLLHQLTLIEHATSSKERNTAAGEFERLRNLPLSTNNVNGVWIGLKQQFNDALDLKYR